MPAIIEEMVVVRYDHILIYTKREKTLSVKKMSSVACIILSIFVSYFATSVW